LEAGIRRLVRYQQTVDLAVGRAGLNQPLKLLHGSWIPLGPRFHSTIIQIAHPPFKLELDRLPVHKHAETDALHSARNQVVFGLVRHSTKVLAAERV